MSSCATSEVPGTLHRSRTDRQPAIAGAVVWATASILGKKVRVPPDATREFGRTFVARQIAIGLGALQALAQRDFAQLAQLRELTLDGVALVTAGERALHEQATTWAIRCMAIHREQRPTAARADGAVRVASTLAPGPAR
jgi:hypothetical protein